MNKKVDAILIQFPNKTIEIPPLGTSVLQEAIQAEGYSCKQYDYNIILKDAFLEVENLLYLLQEVLPYLWESNLNNGKITKDISALFLMIQKIDSDYSLNDLINVKKLLQQREYRTVFCDKDKSEIYRKLIAIISLSNNFFNLITSNSAIEKEFTDLFVFNMIDKVFEDIILKKPEFVGVSIVEMQRQFSLWSIDRLRKKFDYTGNIVVGGSDITYFKSAYIKNFTQVDYAIYQEGEIALVKLLQYLKNEVSSIEEVPNLIYRKGNEIIINNPVCSENFTNIIPNFTDLPLHKYITDALPVQASRGCSWAKCTYCKHFRTYGKDYYEGNPDEIVNQIAILKERYNTSLFHFVDDDFPMKLKNEVVDKIIDRKMNIRWLSYSRFDKKITKEMLKKWYNSGLLVIEWGVESASEEVLKTVKKGTTLKTIKRLLWESYSVGILNKVFMFHNLPDEDYENLWLSLTFLKTFVSQGIVRPFWEILTPLELLVGTPLYENSVNNSEDGKKAFKKVFEPRGELVVQAGYVSKSDYNIKKSILSEALSELKEICQKLNILEMNDEAIMVDVILEDLSLCGNDLAVNTRLK